MRKLILSIILLSGGFAFGQLEYKDVAGTFYARCTNCHHEGANSAPFMNYSQVIAYSGSIYTNLSSDAMPPWNADTTYKRYIHERIITAQEKQDILDWINNGAPAGDTTQAPAPPVYNDGYELQGEPDLELSIGTFTSNAVSADAYNCFAIPSGLLQDRIIRAYEVVPGNRPIVHHAVITADTTGAYTSNLSGGCYNIPGNVAIGTYAPGSHATIFPSQAPLKAGIRLKAGSTVIIQIHYPQGSAGEVDSTKIRLYFYPTTETGVREIYTATPLQNWSMSFPANVVKSYSAYYPTSGTLPVSLSAYAVMPHSHLICTNMLIYAVNPGIDTIPLCKIKKWNFEWQDYYIFKQMVKIPNGYRLYAKHTYDNTASNPYNPNSPPATIYAGTSTTDEMLFDGLMYLYYQNGDELIDIESIINSDPLLTSVKNSNIPISSRGAFPNPFTNHVMFPFVLKDNSNVTITITDIMGKIIRTENLGQRAAGYSDWEWDGQNAGGQSVSQGIYFYKIQTENASFSGKIIKQ